MRFTNQEDHGGKGSVGVWEKGDSEASVDLFFEISTCREVLQRWISNDANGTEFGEKAGEKRTTEDAYPWGIIQAKEERRGSGHIRKDRLEFRGGERSKTQVHISLSTNQKGNFR